jgi:hypothetical protein
MSFIREMSREKIKKKGKYPPKKASGGCGIAGQITGDGLWTPVPGPGKIRMVTLGF